MGEIKYDNRELCKRNFKFFDHLIHKGVGIAFILFFLLIIGGIWFGFSGILSKIIITDVIFFIFCLIYGRIEYLKADEGEFLYHDDYSKVIETPKKGEKQQLNG